MNSTQVKDYFKGTFNSTFALFFSCIRKSSVNICLNVFFLFSMKVKKIQKASEWWQNVITINPLNI